MEPSLKIQEVDGLELVKKFAEEMETMLHRKVEAVEVRSPELYWEVSFCQQQSTDPEFPIDTTEVSSCEDPRNTFLLIWVLPGPAWRLSVVI